MVGHNHLKLQFQGIPCPLLTSTGTKHVHGAGRKNQIKQRSWWGVPERKEGQSDCVIPKSLGFAWFPHSMMCQMSYFSHFERVGDYKVSEDLCNLNSSPFLKKSHLKGTI